MLVDWYEPTGSYVRNISYLSGRIMSVQQLAKLTDISAHCEHFIKYKCLDSMLRSGPGSVGYMHGWWVLRHGKAMTYWEGENSTPYKCACGLNRSCVDPCYGCNSYINDNIWREDRELPTKKAEFPVIQLRWYRGSARRWTRLNTLGKRKCYSKSRERCKLYFSVKYKWMTDCIKAKNQTSFKSVKKLESMVLKYKIPYLLKLNPAKLCY